VDSQQQITGLTVVNFDFHIGSVDLPECCIVFLLSHWICSTL